MQSSTQYRLFAEECYRLAKTSRTEHERKVLEEMADAWAMLAEDAERKRSGAAS
jgi:hypothetical protein